MALEWRRDGLDRIAQQIRLALGDESEQADEAIKDIAGQMAVFMASDVAWDTRVIPFITQRARGGGDRRPGDQPVAVPGQHRSGCSRRRSPRCSTSSSPAATAAASRPAPACTARGSSRRSYGDDAASARRQQPADLRARHRLRRQLRQPGRERRVRRQGDAADHPRGRRPDHHLDDDPAGGGRRDRPGRAAARRPAAARHRGDHPRRTSPACRARRRWTTTRPTIRPCSRAAERS